MADPHFTREIRPKASQRGRAAMRLKRIAHTENAAIGSIGNVIINVWRRTPTVELIRLRRPWCEYVAANHSRCAVYTILDSDRNHALPDAQHRAESKHQMAMVEGLSVCTATVFPHQSLMASLVRTFLRGQARFARGGVTLRNFEEVSDASKWLVQQVQPEGPTLAQLTVAVNVLVGPLQ